MNAFLGFDIGGSHIKYAFGTSELGLLLSDSIPTPTNDLSSFKAAFGHIIAIVHAAVPQLTISAIGIGTPGTIDRRENRIRGINPNLPFWTDQDPRSLIPSALGIPVAFDNDANLMTLAESTCGDKHGTVLGITVGTGIGSGLVSSGRIFHGGRGFALELGHISMLPNGERCSCGLQGCLEAYSSLSGIRKRAGRFNPHFAELDLTELIQAAKLHPELAQVIEEGRFTLCRGIANAMILLDPDRVIIGGGCMDGGLYSIATLESDIRTLLPLVNQHSSISGAQMGNKAGVWGAIILAEALLSEITEQNVHLD